MIRRPPRSPLFPSPTPFRSPIDHWRGLEPRLRDPRAHPELRGVVGNTPRHVVDRSRPPGATHEAADRAHVYDGSGAIVDVRSEEHTSELQSRSDLVCRLLLE